MHLLTTGSVQSPTSFFEDIFSRCLLCTACEQVCPRHLPITDLISQARSGFSPFYGPNGLKKAIVCTSLAHSELLEGLVKAGISLQALHALPAFSGLRLKLGLLEKAVEPSLPRNSDISSEEQSMPSGSYFIGCFARHIQPSIAAATRAKPIALTAVAIILGSALLAGDPVFGGLGVALISGTVAAVFVSLLFIPVLMDNAKAMDFEPIDHLE